MHIKKGKWSQQSIRKLKTSKKNQHSREASVHDFPIDFGTDNGHCSFAVPNQSENGKYNLISVWFNKIS